MKSTVINTVTKIYVFARKVLLLCLMFSLLMTACSPATPTALSEPTIVSSRACELKPGESIPLAVAGISGSGIGYSWSASRGVVIPPNGPTVTYTAPDSGGDVFITVLAEKDGQTTDGLIICKVNVPTPLPTDTLPSVTPIPTTLPTPIPTTWECTSYRSGEVRTSNSEIPGDVKINTPLQGTIGISSGQSIQVAGTYTGFPAGIYLWVFIYSATAGEHGRYYPQTRAAVNGWQPEPTTGQDGGWSINVSFGAENICYEVIVVATSSTASQTIADQLAKWATFNNFSGYELGGIPSADPPAGVGFPSGLVEKASIEVKTK